MVLHGIINIGNNSFPWPEVRTVEILNPKWGSPHLRFEYQLRQVLLQLQLQPGWECIVQGRSREGDRSMQGWRGEEGAWMKLYCMGCECRGGHSAVGQLLWFWLELLLGWVRAIVCSIPQSQSCHKISSRAGQTTFCPPPPLLPGFCFSHHSNAKDEFQMTPNN